MEKKQPKRGYRYNMCLDADLRGYLEKVTFTNNTSKTQYLNDLIRADMEAYLAAGNVVEPFWDKGSK